MSKKFIQLLLVVAGIAFPATADDSYNDFLKDAKADYDAFLKEARDDYAAFRDSMNRQYAEFLKGPWNPKSLEDPVEPPREDPVPPLIVPDDEPLPLDTMPVVIDNVVPLPEWEDVPAPQPIVPLPQDIVIPSNYSKIPVYLYGTEFTVVLPTYNPVKSSVTNYNIGDAWLGLSKDSGLLATIDNLLENRDKYNLNDWAYYRLIQECCSKVTGTQNEKAFLEGFLMAQSGYGIRYGFDDSGKLYLLLKSDRIIAGEPYFVIEGYIYNAFNYKGSALKICDGEFGNAKPMNWIFRQLPALAYDNAPEKEVTITHYQDIKLRYRINKNLMSFFEDYPQAMVPGNFNINQWECYTNVPLSKDVQNTIYPVLRNAIKGKSQRDAANILIDFCETFPYAYDDEVWGCDRPFFAEETLYYPGSDCEDHAILFSRLVRDLMGLDVALVNYPGHLATAVAFTEDVPGSYVNYQSRRWTICDPTIFFAGVGHTMSGMKNSEATLYILK